MENPMLDWRRIIHLLKLGLFAGIMVLIGDMLLGWGVADPTANGIPMMLTRYLSIPDGRIFASALLGLIGIPLECLCWFAVYRMIRPYSDKDAHAYRAGIIGCLAFGGCGVHVPSCMAVYLLKHFYADAPATAPHQMLRWLDWFLLPATVIFLRAGRHSLGGRDAPPWRPCPVQCSCYRMDQHRKPVDDGWSAGTGQESCGMTALMAFIH